MCSLEAWDDVWRRNQFLVRELLRREPQRRVLFVEPPVDALFELTKGRLRHGDAVQPIAADDHVLRFRPTKLLPRMLGPAADRMLVRQLLDAIAVAGFRRPTLWINDPVYAGLAEAARWPVVYDVTDDWLRATATPRDLRRRRQREEVLLREADEVIVCSPDLARSKSGTRAVHLIPNAVDIDHFQTPHPKPADLPDGTVAVYVGTLHEDRLDVDLCAELADRLPWLRVAFIGPCALTPSSRDRLTALPNVAVLGARPHDDVPAYLQHADVIVIPHVVSPFTESLDPIKAYECLAVPTPTVATAVAGFRELSDCFHIAARTDFVDVVADVARNGHREPHGITPPSWSERAGAVAAVLRDAEETSPSTHAASKPVAAVARRERRLQVAYVDHCAQLSGGEVALSRLLAALGQVDAMVILGEAGPLEADLERRGVASSVLPMHPDLQSLRREHVRPGRALLGESATAVAYTVRLTRELKRRQPDLVATNSLKAALYGGLAGRLAGIPVVWHLRDRLAADYLPAPAVRLLHLLARGIPSAVIANSRTTANTIGAASVARRTFVVHDPVEPTDVPSHRVEPEVRRVGLVGRIAPWKGQDLFLRAFARAFQHTDTEAVIVGAALFGEHEYERALHELVSALGLAGRVDFRGFRTDVDAELLRLDILVHASTIPEPFGMVVIEGMALGLPVVVPDRGGPSEVVSADHDGVTYRLGDVDSLAAALTRVASDADGRQRLGRAARVTAARFAPEQVADEVQSVYEWVLAHKP